MFRSVNIWGPYEVFTGNPILTQHDLPADRPNPVTCTGHADLVETPNGDRVAAGADLDGKHFSTKVVGGYAGTYCGLYAFAQSPGQATFEMAAYREIKNTP